MSPSLYLFFLSLYAAYSQWNLYAYRLLRLLAKSIFEHNHKHSNKWLIPLAATFWNVASEQWSVLDFSLSLSQLSFKAEVRCHYWLIASSFLLFLSSLPSPLFSLPAELTLVFHHSLVTSSALSLQQMVKSQPHWFLSFQTLPSRWV